MLAISIGFDGLKFTSFAIGLCELRFVVIIRSLESMVQESKKNLRRDMKALLASLDPRWIEKAQSELCVQLNSLLLSLGEGAFKFQNVLMWIPCFVGEPDLSECIHTMLPLTSVYLPRIEESNTISFTRIDEDWRDNLEQGYRGIRQPRADYGTPFLPVDGDENLIIVPGIAFSPDGRRLGRGGGHYDKFCSEPALSTAVKIGICWSMQLIQEIPIASHDISMDWICYERGALKVSHG